VSVVGETPEPNRGSRDEGEQDSGLAAGKRVRPLDGIPTVYGWDEPEPVDETSLDIQRLRATVARHRQQLQRIAQFQADPISMAFTPLAVRRELQRQANASGVWLDSALQALARLGAGSEPAPVPPDERQSEDLDTALASAPPPAVAPVGITTAPQPRQQLRGMHVPPDEVPIVMRQVRVWRRGHTQWARIITRLLPEWLKTRPDLDPLWREVKQDWLSRTFNAWDRTNPE
jgi:hypothetical protein